MGQLRSLRDITSGNLKDELFLISLSLFVFEKLLIIYLENICGKC